MPAQCMHAVDVRFTATPNWRERRARNGQNLTKSKKCTSDKKSLPFVAVAITLFEIESHKAFSHCSALKRTAKSARKREQNFVVVKTGL